MLDSPSVRPTPSPRTMSAGRPVCNAHKHTWCRHLEARCIALLRNALTYSQAPSICWRFAQSRSHTQTARRREGSSRGLAPASSICCQREQHFSLPKSPPAPAPHRDPLRELTKARHGGTLVKAWSWAVEVLFLEARDRGVRWCWLVFYLAGHPPHAVHPRHCPYHTARFICGSLGREEEPPAIALAPHPQRWPPAFISSWGRED